ncbi:hypothetical protein SMGD1_0422 [Sulfurimonas gotlandica GD1]|uniref:General glycosylation pathway protein n=1 Tax=Sulfurimonas gotlandica (strain DSM 19862 / JCM 16533 / GD1) TaxID=929558 RepID=B6BK96_SULGG|nr:hypothetical protein [Sulfurimonas gotlandica]EDZ62460.1 conserved hypothetical protein [Sulfurimonas gotlandica GD1]EHP28949.1 hypothetical protein SMGD1_0422 [Sulfurimonas gotlandica GD1]
MQEFMTTYKENVLDIENFLIETVFNLGNVEYRESDDYKKVFKVFPSLELIYTCDEESMLQTSPNIYRNKSSDTPIGRNREYLLNKIDFDDSDIAITKPYISSATSETCITVAKKENGKIYFLDFNISVLLQRLGLVEVHNGFNFVSKSFYFLTANIMMILALFTIGYSVYEFIHSLLFKDGLSIEAIFKPVIALTLGLAIFDLAKTVFAQEVVFKSYSKNSHEEYKVLTKFSITILIALLIESLMVVFKIAIDDYSQMIHAFYLIGGVSILMIALGLFIYFTKKKV